MSKKKQPNNCVDIRTKELVTVRKVREREGHKQVLRDCFERALDQYGDRIQNGFFIGTVSTDNGMGTLIAPLVKEGEIIPTSECAMMALSFKKDIEELL